MNEKTLIDHLTIINELVKGMSAKMQTMIEKQDEDLELYIDIKDQIKEIDERIDVLNERCNQLIDTIDTLDSNIYNLSNEIDRIKSNIKDLESSREELTTTLDDLSERLEEMKEDADTQGVCYESITSY